MIPDDEPWWMVRRSMYGDQSTDGRSMSTAAAIGDRYDGILSLPRTCPLAAERQQATLDYLDNLPFRPIGYEW